MSTLKIFQDRAIKAKQDAGAEMFLGIPDDWYEPCPEYGCENGHVSRRYLKSEERGCLCLACQLPIAMIPHGYTDETLAAALDAIKAEKEPA